MTGRVRIGLSGWTYPGWKDGFYAGVPRRAWLEHAASVFDTLEVNATFYREQKAATLEGWRDRTPADFRFAVKGHRYLTHNLKLKDAAGSLERQRRNLAPIAGKTRAVLWQLPERMRPDRERLRDFLDALAAWQGPTHAIEMRDPDWFTDTVAGLLDAAGVANVLSDAADWPLWDAVTGGLAYLRLHGRPRTYHSAYSATALDAWARRIAAWRAAGNDVLVYFDNDAEGAAPRDAQALREMLGETAERS